jgi:hypothetical protein
MADLYYIEQGYYTPDGYFVYVANADAALAPQFTCSVSGDIVKVISADLIATSTVTADALVVKLGESAVNATVSLSCDNVIYKNATSALASQSTISVSASVIQNASSQLEATTTTSAQVNRTAGLASTMLQETAVSATISHIEGADLFAFGNSQLTAQANAIKSLNIETSSVFDIAVDAVRGIYISAQADSDVDLAVDYLRNRQTQAALEAALSLAASSNVTANALATLDTTSQSSTTINLTRDVEALVSSTTALTSDAVATVSATIDIVSQTAGTLNASAIISNFAILESSTALTAQAVKTARINSDNQAQTAVSATIQDMTKQADIAMSVDCQVTVLISKIQPAEITATAQTALTANAVKTTVNSADLTLTTEVTAGVAGIYSAVSDFASISVDVSVVNKIGNTFVDCAVTSSMVASGDRIRFGASDFASEFDIALIKTYWFNKLAGTDNNPISHVSLAVDNLKNSYVIAQQSTNSYLVKYAKNGTIEWQKQIDESGQLIVDSLSNPYRITNNSITKFNSLGTVVWKKQIATGTIHEAVVDASSNVWFASSTNTREFYLSKIDSLGNLNSIFLDEFAYTTPVGGGTLVPTANFVSITQNSTDVIVSLRRINTAPDVHVFTAAKTYPSSGTVTRLLVAHSSSLNYGEAKRVFRNQAGDYYIIYGATQTPVVQRISSSGVKIWVSEWPIDDNLPVSSKPSWIPSGARLVQDNFQGMYLDFVDRLAIASTVVVFPVEGGFYRRTEVLYINSAGRIENQFYLETQPNTTGHDADLVYVNPDGEFYVSGEDKDDAYLAWLPPAGEGTGTYIPESWNYQKLTYDIQLSTNGGRGTVSKPYYTLNTATISLTTTTPEIGTNSSLTRIFTPFNINSFDITSNVIALTTENYLTVDAGIVKQPGLVPAESSTLLNATAYDFTQADADLVASSQLSAALGIVKEFDLSIAGTSIQLTASVTVGEVAIDADSEFVLNVSAVKTTDTAQSLLATSQLSALAGLIQSADIAVAATTAIEASADKFKSGRADFESTTVLATTAVKTTDTTVDLAVQAFNLTIAVSGRPGEVIINAESQLACQGQRIRYSQADLDTQTVQTASLGITKRHSASLTVQSFTLSVGTVTRIDPYYQLIIKPETRYLVINRESRQLDVDLEQREFIINTETRTLDIDPETRTLLLEGH